jgi:hypothetical protein
MIGGVCGAARLRRDSLRDTLFAPFRSEVEWNVDTAEDIHLSNRMPVSG